MRGTRAVSLQKANISEFYRVFHLTGRVKFSYFRVLQGVIPIMPKSPKQASPGSEPISFEAALAELEKLVAGMESGQLSLEQSIAAHKRGLELAQYCQAKLTLAQQQVQVLEANTLQAFPGAEQDS